MKIVILGGSGFIGRHLSLSLAEDGHHVTILTRNPSKLEKHLGPLISAVEWDPVHRDTLEQIFDGKDAVINLAGEPIADHRWTEARKNVLRDSRIHLTNLVVTALSNVKVKPQVLINASAIGYYGPTSMEMIDEQHPPGTGFSAELCVDWEKEAARAETLGIRVVQTRIGMVLGLEGGALPKMLLPFRLFLGGPILPGTQPVSWIHWLDLVNLIKYILDHKDISGPINAVSPNSVDMTEFCRTLGASIKRPSWFPVPAFVLKIALGELSTLMTTGQAVKPGVASASGFKFTYPTLAQALTSVVKTT